LREERRLRVFENRALRRLFGPKRDVVTGEWRKLHNKERNDLYPSLNIVKSKIIRWAEYVACMVERREIYSGFLWGNLRGKRPLGRSRYRWG
jgi:hypothetical protein